MAWRAGGAGGCRAGGAGLQWLNRLACGAAVRPAQRAGGRGGAPRRAALPRAAPCAQRGEAGGAGVEGVGTAAPAGVAALVAVLAGGGGAAVALEAPQVPTGGALAQAWSWRLEGDGVVQLCAVVPGAAIHAGLAKEGFAALAASHHALPAGELAAAPALSAIKVPRAGWAAVAEGTETKGAGARRAENFPALLAKQHSASLANPLATFAALPEWLKAWEEDLRAPWQHLLAQKHLNFSL